MPLKANKPALAPPPVPAGTEPEQPKTNLPDLPEVLIIKIASLLDLTSLGLNRCVCKALDSAAKQVLGDLQSLALFNGSIASTSPAGPTMLLTSLLPHCPKLTTLCLKGCHQWVGDPALTVVATLAPQLQTLLLEHCCLITGKGIEELCIPGRLKRLKVLSLRSCGNVGTGEPLARLQSLKRLDLGWCHSLSPQAIRKFAPRLETLSLHGCELVDDTVCTDMPLVEELDLAFTRVGDAGLTALASGSPLLRSLTLATRSSYNLWATGMWTEQGLKKFAAGRPEVALAFKSC